eukprot:1149389-Pelagomonas_calceolata.AAC.13
MPQDNCGFADIGLSREKPSVRTHYCWAGTKRSSASLGKNQFKCMEGKGLRKKKNCVEKGGVTGKGLQ